MAEVAPRDVNGEISFMARHERFKSEKPYMTAFPVDGIEGGKRTNQIFETKLKRIEDVRGGLQPQLDKNGFTYLRVPTALSIPDFDSPETVRSIYFTELSTALRKQFPQYSAWVFFNYEVRKRSPLYPTAGAVVNDAQPVCEAHVDFTPDGAMTRLKGVLADSQTHLLSRPCDLLNIWRVTNGPTDDWPLGLCDFQSIDPQSDIINNDIVFENSVGEDSYLHDRSEHRWYYMSSQDKDEIIVWRNVDIPDATKPRAFHAAFAAKQDGAERQTLRQSIEVRVAAFT